MPLLRYTAMINGFDTLLITKLDVMDQLAEIPVCTGYRLKGQDLTEMPADLPRARSPGTRLSKPPRLANRNPRHHSLRIAAEECAGLSEVPRRPHRRLKSAASPPGPKRNETIIRPGSKLERLIKERTSSTASAPSTPARNFPPLRRV